MKLIRLAHALVIGSLFVPFVFVRADDIIILPSTTPAEVVPVFAATSSNGVTGDSDNASVGIHRPWRYELAQSVVPSSTSAVGLILGGASGLDNKNIAQDLVGADNASVPPETDPTLPSLPPLSTAATPPMMTSDAEVAVMGASEVTPEEKREAPDSAVPDPAAPNSASIDSADANPAPTVNEAGPIAVRSLPVRKTNPGDRIDESAMRMDRLLHIAAQNTNVITVSSIAIAPNEVNDRTADADSHVMPALATTATNPLIILKAESGPAMPADPQTVQNTSEADESPAVEQSLSDQPETRNQPNDQPTRFETPPTPAPQDDPPQVQITEAPVVSDQSAIEEDGTNSGGQSSGPRETAESPMKGTAAPPKSAPVSNRAAEVRTAERKDVSTFSDHVRAEIRKAQADSSTKSTVTTTPDRVKKPTATTALATYDGVSIPKWFWPSVAIVFGYFWLTQFLSLLLMCKHDFPRTRDKKKWIITFVAFFPIAPFAFLRWKWEYYDYHLFPRKDTE